MGLGSSGAASERCTLEGSARLREFLPVDLTVRGHPGGTNTSEASCEAKAIEGAGNQ
jgi:hypothetical protein